MDWLDNLYAVKSVNGQIGDVEITTLDQLYSEVTITGLSGTYNSLDVTGFNDASCVALSAVALGSATVNGIKAPPNEVNGLVKLVRLPFSAFLLTLTHNSGSAAAADKIITTGESDITNQGPGNTDVYVLLTRCNGAWLASRLGTRHITFGTSTQTLSTVPPTANQVLVSSGTLVSGVTPGAIMARMTASNSSTTALTSASNQRLTWNGSATPSFTFSSGSAVDGATITIFFPGSSISSIALSSDLDPTGTVVYAFDAASAAYRLTMQYLADGPSIVCSLRKVTDL